MREFRASDARFTQLRTILFDNFCILTWGHVEYEWDSAAECDHDDAEGDEEEEDVLQHAADRQDDGAKVLRRDANLQQDIQGDYGGQWLYFVEFDFVSAQIALLAGAQLGRNGIPDG